jgi:hypothetical protein
VSVVQPEQISSVIEDVGLVAAVKYHAGVEASIGVVIYDFDLEGVIRVLRSVVKAVTAIGGVDETTTVQGGAVTRHVGEVVETVYTFDNPTSMYSVR